MTLPYNKICNLEDFRTAELMPAILEVFGHEQGRFGPDFPAGHEARKYWEVAMAVRALRDCGALRPDAELLGIGAGHEPTVFHLTRFVKRVFATDLYLAPGAWEAQAHRSMLTEPEQNWPFAWNPRRLVVQHMDALDLRYEDESFDGIFSSSSIEHFGDHHAVGQAIDEIYRTLRPGGILSLSSEFRIAGPSPGPPGCLMFSLAEIFEVLLGHREWDLVSPFDADVSPATLGTEDDLNRIMRHQTDQERRHGGLFSFKTKYDRYPHIVLRIGPHLITSFHIAVRKAG